MAATLKIMPIYKYLGSQTIFVCIKTFQLFLRNMSILKTNFTNKAPSESRVDNV